MGNTVAKAQADEGTAQEKNHLQELKAILNNKLREMLLLIEQARGDAEDLNKKEVAGGRTAMRTTDVRVSNSTGVDEQLKQGINDFFLAAEGQAQGENAAAKQNAIKGAENMLQGAMDALFGAVNGSAVEKSAFYVMFINNAFVRVDTRFYSYNCSSAAWGTKSNEAGLCYVADISVLQTTDLTSAELDFFLSQALNIQSKNMRLLTALKLELMLQEVLSVALRNKDTDFEKLKEITDKVEEAQTEIDTQMKKEDDKQGLKTAPVQSVVLPKVAPPPSDGASVPASGGASVPASGSAAVFKKP